MTEIFPTVVYVLCFVTSAACAWMLGASYRRNGTRLLLWSAICFGLLAASNLVLVAAIVAAGGAPIHPIWPLLYCAGLGVSFIYYWPTLLALVSRTSPAKVNATLMGLAFMSLFVANNVVGWVGGFYETMGPARFWGLHAVISAAGGLLVALFGRRLSGWLQPGPA